MRSNKKSLLVLLACLAGAVVAVPGETGAQTFPVNWTPLTRGGAVITGSVGGNAYEDIVGDSSNPAAYVHSDTNYLYMRIRLNADPTSGNAIRTDRIYGCEIDTDTDNNYELLAIYDGVANEIVLRQNSGAATGNRTDNAATIVSNVAPGGYPTGTFGRVVAPAGSTFSSNADAFVDIAIPRTALDTVAAQSYRTLRFACGTGDNVGGTKALGLQLFEPNAVALATVWSDSFVCGTTGCLLDSDRDGVPNVTETGFGTDPNDTDTDNDGILDNVELSASGSTGPYTGPDTDGDGVIDAKDTDSDNDCFSDQQEGAAGYRSTSANAYTQCLADTTKPACSTTTGTCAECDGPNNGATPAKCPTAAAPACFGAQGCKQCGPGQTQNCTNAGAPACGSTGACTACTGDNGATTNAPCPSSGAPACHTSGPLFGQCKECSRQNGSLCTSASLPACDTTTGACGTCNGDFGGIESKPCAIEGAPTCHITTGSVGTCFKCTTNADCLESSKHNGPTCEVATGKCIDTDSDGDGLNDSIELNLGTDPTKVDTDGDGISDNVEARPSGGGNPAKIDTDGDGTIDALDLDSDNDTVLDAQEGTVDTDNDTAPNFRDPDDDGDGIPTSIEVVDGQVAKVSDDVDMDGKKNWLDSDSDNNGIDDGTEGRGDEDLDGIPDYLDMIKDPPKVDAGSSSSSTSSSGSPPVDGGFTSSEEDAAVPKFDAGPIEEGVVEGTGLFCGRATGSSGLADLGVIFIGAFLAMTASRRRRR
jgi:hypothetical protein